MNCYLIVCYPIQHPILLPSPVSRWAHVFATLQFLSIKRKERLKDGSLEAPTKLWDPLKNCIFSTSCAKLGWMSEINWKEIVGSRGYLLILCFSAKRSWEMNLIRRDLCDQLIVKSTGKLWWILWPNTRNKQKEAPPTVTFRKCFVIYVPCCQFCRINLPYDPKLCFSGLKDQMISQNITNHKYIHAICLGNSTG